MPINVGLLGTGNIGTDLLVKILSKSANLKVNLFAGIDPQSEGIALANQRGVQTSTDGIEGILSDPSIKIVFDATSAGAHLKHAPLLKKAEIIAIDLTPAAVGPYVVPAIALDRGIIKESNINMVTCGGQATIPMVYAVSRIANVIYAETVTTIPSLSAGPGTRGNIDEFTDTTAKGVKSIGRAERSKSIIILNPASPPISNRHTIYALLEEEANQTAILASVEDMVRTVQHYVPGYRLKYPPVFDGKRVTIMVEVEGAGDFLPKYAGNLDIMTSAALATGEAIAQYLIEEGGR